MLRPTFPAGVASSPPPAAAPPELPPSSVSWQASYLGFKSESAKLSDATCLYHSRQRRGINISKSSDRAHHPDSFAPVRAKYSRLQRSIMASLKHHGDTEKVKVTGTVLLEKKNVLDFNSQSARIGDAVGELLGNKVKLQLVSVDIDPATQEGKRSGEAYLEHWIEKSRILFADVGTAYSVNFSLNSDFGLPGAVLIDNDHPNEFFLVSIILAMPDKTEIHFQCNSWVYPTKNDSSPRVFFFNQACFANDTPAGLRKLRFDELTAKQGDGSGKRQSADRIYDYDVYNDLGNPDEKKEYARPILGGSKEYPYPRRCRTGRKRTKADVHSESPPADLESVYVPRDEQFGHVKESDFLGSAIKSFARDIVPDIEDIFKDGHSFESFDEVFDLYTEGINFGERAYQKTTKEDREAEFKTPLELIRELTDPHTGDPGLLKFPTPDIVQENKEHWMLDDEFARQTLCGLNPLSIERLKVFPPVSTLDEKIYGPATSTITAQHLDGQLEGLSVQQALRQNKLFIIDHNDIYMPFLERVNAQEGRKGYASRSIFFLTKEGTLKLVAIELSLPPSSAGQPSSHKVFTPPQSGERDWNWYLAKTHAIVNDSGHHQLVSHWLKTHGALEPFIIASNRQLSSLHPIYALLSPHFKNTMNINALARQALINCDSGSFLLGGIIEKAFTPGRYSMELSSAAYKSWRFDEEGLPADLIKRGMAVKDSASSKHGLRLVIEDYPYAVDGLEIWSAIEDWVSDYVSVFYKEDKVVRDDSELQSWWVEIMEVGHGDKRSERWWVNMQTVEELKVVLVTLIWLASAHHAAVNFGQYIYSGFMPNKPTITRKLIPEVGTPEHEQLLQNPMVFYLTTVSSQAQATTVMATLELLSTHASDEEYLGQRTSTLYWTNNQQVISALERFNTKLREVEKAIEARNADPKLKNRLGVAKIPYTLLFPTSKGGMTGRGIPNSVSI